MTAWAVEQASLGDLVETGLDSIEQAMVEATSSEVAVLQEASRHILQAGGKRIRPRLMLLCYLALGGNDLALIAKPAAAVELMHTASVVHDDINDHGIVRRGRPSVNSIWGRTFALLTGDFLFTAVYELMAPYQDLNVDLASAATALVEGETLQASAVKDNLFTREIYMRIIALKTAALFRAAGKIGAKLANGGGDAVDALANFAFNLGLAFQIRDDILDLVSDESTLGKSAGLDLEQGKGLAVALNETGSHSRNGSHSGVDQLNHIKRRMLQGNAIAKAREQADLLVRSAIAQLAVIPDSHYKEELLRLANLVIEREY